MELHLDLAYQLTWLAEGTSDQCNRIHWPGGASGVTWGKGFDVRFRNQADVASILQDCQINATWFPAAAGLSGAQASTFVAQNKNRQVLSEEEMRRLFEYCWNFEMNEVERICTKADVVRRYGKVPFDILDARIAVMLGDLKYRGDYSPALREKIQAHVVANNRPAFTAALETVKATWPSDRALRRMQFLAA